MVYFCWKGNKEILCLKFEDFRYHFLENEKFRGGCRYFFMYNCFELFPVEDYSHIPKYFCYLPHSFDLFWILSPHRTQFSSFQSCNGDLRFAGERVSGQALQSLLKQEFPEHWRAPWLRKNCRVRCREVGQEWLGPADRRAAEPHPGPLCQPRGPVWTPLAILLNPSVTSVFRFSM